MEITARIDPSLAAMNVALQMIEDALCETKPKLKACYLTIDNAQSELDKNVSGFED